MNNPMPILLVPGLGASPRIYAPVIPAIWRHGPVMVANHISDDSIGAIARVAHRQFQHALPVYAHELIECAALAGLGAHH